MSHWKTEQWIKEREELYLRFPSLNLVTEAKGCRTFTGPLEAAPGVSFTIRLVLPATYPKDVPTLYCSKDEIPWEARRHVFSDTGAACLCTQSEYRMHWPRGSTITVFMEKLVLPYLICQFFFQTHGFWPKTGQRSHGPKGIEEAYAEIAAPLGNTSVATIRRLMSLLCRKADPKGHEICPCGSGLNLRKCHGAIVRSLRTKIEPKHAHADYTSVFGAEGSKRS